MKVLLLGSGGREHALAWKIVQSPKLGKLYVAPGNAGTAQLAENVSLAVTDFRAIGDFIQDKQIDLLVVVLRIRWWKEYVIFWKPIPVSGD